MPMDRRRYPKNWSVISRRIRARAQGKCEWCHAEQGQPHPITGSRVVLTVAHLGVDYADGTPGDKRDKMDCRDDNLAALCQRCHIRFDVDERRMSAARPRQEQQRVVRGQAQQLELWGQSLLP